MLNKDNLDYPAGDSIYQKFNNDRKGPRKLECKIFIYQNSSTPNTKFENFYWHYGNYPDGEELLPEDLQEHYKENLINKDCKLFFDTFKECAGIDNFAEQLEINNNSEQRGDKMSTKAELLAELKKLDETTKNSDVAALNGVIAASQSTPLELLDTLKSLVLPCDKYMEAFRMLVLDKLKVVETGEYWAPKGKDARLPETVRAALREAQGKKDIREITLESALGDVSKTIRGLGNAVKIIGNDAILNSASTDAGCAALVADKQTAKTRAKRTKQIGEMAVDGRDVKIQID